MSLRIRKGDQIVVLSGRDKGKKGRVVHVYPDRQRALVEGINMMKKAVRKSQKNPQGGMIHQEALIHLSKLSLVCPATAKPTRIKTLIAQDGSKQRISALKKAVIA